MCKWMHACRGAACGVGARVQRAILHSGHSAVRGATHDESDSLRTDPAEQSADVRAGGGDMRRENQTILQEIAQVVNEAAMWVRNARGTSWRQWDVMASVGGRCEGGVGRHAL